METNTAKPGSGILAGTDDTSFSLGPGFGVSKPPTGYIDVLVDNSTKNGHPIDTASVSHLDTARDARLFLCNYRDVFPLPLDSLDIRHHIHTIPNPCTRLQLLLPVDIRILGASGSDRYRGESTLFTITLNV